MKGDRFTIEPKRYEDAGVSPQVLRVTSEEETCNHLYFTSRSFTPDDTHLVFESDRSGGHDLCCLDLASHEAVQLTEGKDLDYFPYIDRRGGRVFFGEGGLLRAVDLNTLEETTLLDAATLVGHPVKKCSGMYQSWDGARLVCFFEADPDYGLIVVELDTLEARILLKGDQPVRHCQFCPFDPHLILYAHEGNWSTMQARMWLIRDDGTGNRRLRDHDDGTTEAVGHESWSNTEKKIYFKLQREGTIYVASYDLPTETETVLYEQRHNHGIVSLDDRYFIADDREGPMHLLDLRTGEEHPLCHPYMSWRKGWSRFHPHPTISNNGEWVVYSTDHYGKPGVFIAKLP